MSSQISTPAVTETKGAKVRVYRRRIGIKRVAQSKQIPACWKASYMR